MELESNQPQIEPQLPKIHVWGEQDEEDKEEEEAGAGLVTRQSHSKRRINGVATTPSSVISESEFEPALFHTNGLASSEHADQEEENQEVAADNSQQIGVMKDAKEEDNVVKEGDGIRNSVYFDQRQGKWKCRHCNWTHQIGSPCLLDVDNPKGYLTMAMNTQTLNQWLETKGIQPINGASDIQSEITKTLNENIESPPKVSQKEDTQSSSKLYGNEKEQSPLKISHDEVTGIPQQINHNENAQNSEHTSHYETDSHQTISSYETTKRTQKMPGVNKNWIFSKFSIQKGKATVAEDAAVDLIGEIEEDLVGLDVERVLEKQNTHDLFCPNCNSCITRRVILRKRKRMISNVHPNSKHMKKLESNSASVVDAGIAGPTEIEVSVSPTADSVVQNNNAGQEQEAFSCLSCFSLFIPIGNGCFKMFNFFRHGRKQNDSTQSAEEIRQRETTESPQQTNQREEIRGSQKINQDDITESPQVISQNESIESSPKVSQNEETQSPSKMGCNEEEQSPLKKSHDEATGIPQQISHSENAQNSEHINHYETSSRQQISCNEEATQSHQNINQSESKQSPLKKSHDEVTGIPQQKNAQNSEHTNRYETNSRQQISCNEEATQSHQSINHSESKQNPLKRSHDEVTGIPQQKNAQNSEHTNRYETSSPRQISCNEEATQSQQNTNQNGSTQSPPKMPRDAAVPALLVTNGERVDDAVMKSKKPGIGDNEIQDLEVGLLEPELPPRAEVAPSSQTGTQNERIGADAGEAHDWEILKSIVYGGLIESITSLGVVSSAAGADADALNVLVLGMANLIGGLLLILHNLRELKKEQPHGTSTEINNEEDRYQVLLGQRENFVLHTIVAILSFLVFGLVPPVVYGFSFRKSDDKDLKLAAVAGASLLCIFFLALGKGHVRRPRRAYFSTISYYVALGITASGISFLVGELIRKLLIQLGLFDSTSPLSTPPFLGTISLGVGRSAY